MAEPIRISIFFEANGRAALQKGAEDVERLNARLNRLAATVNGLPRALRAAENNLNQFANTAYTRGLTGISFLNEQFSNLFNLATRFAKIGFGGLIATTGLAVYNVKSLGQEFLKVNEAFANLEISVGSAFKSSTIGRDLRNQLRQITVTSPVPFKGLADATRAVSYIPQLSSQIGRQAAAGTLSDPKGFFRQYIQLVEQLLVFRPDKAVTDATFAIREAATGELRSLIRRFDFPAQLLVTASGKSIDDLKRDPVAMVGAIKKSLDKIITPQAIRQIAFQPTRLFDNILEQIKDIPLLEIGDAGLYDKILGFFERLFNGASEFVTQRFPAYAKSFSQKIGSIFDGFIESTDRISERFLGLFNLDASALPSLSKFERIVIGIEKTLASVNENLPAVMDRVSKLTSQLVPFFLKLMSSVVSVIDYVSEKFNKAPILTLVGAYLVTQTASIFRAGSKLFFESLIEVQKTMRANMVLPTLTRAAQQGVGGAAAGAAGAAAGAANGIIYPYRYPQQPAPGTFNPFLGAAGTRGSGALLSIQQQQQIARNAATYASNVAILRSNGFRQVGNTPNFVSTAVGGIPITVSALGDQVSRRTTLFGGPTLGAQGLSPVTGPGFTQQRQLHSSIQRFQTALGGMNLALNQAGITAVQTGQALQRNHLYNSQTGRAISAAAFLQAQQAYSANPINLRPPPVRLVPGMRLPPAGLFPGNILQYNQYMDAAAQARGPLYGAFSGNFWTGLAGRTGAGLLAGGASAGVAGAVSGAVLTTGALAATIAPVLAVVAASAVFTLLLDKASEYFEKRATRIGREAAEAIGFTDSRVARTEREGQEANNFLARLQQYEANNGSIAARISEAAFLQLPVLNKTRGLRASSGLETFNADVVPIPQDIEGAPITSAGNRRSAKIQNFIEGIRSITPALLTGLGQAIRTNDNYTYSLDQQSVSLEDFRVGVAKLTTDYTRLNEALRKGETAFDGLRAGDLKLLSDPEINITSFKQLENVAFQIGRAMNLAQVEVRKLSEATQKKLGFGVEQILNEPQQAIFSRIEDLQKTFLGDGKQGPQGYVTALQNERNAKGVPSKISAILSQLGPLRESQEIARIVENNSQILGNIVEQVNPFEFLKNSFEEENKRLEDIRNLRRQALQLGPDNIGKDSAANIRSLLEQARKNGVRIGQDSRKAFEKLADDLESGAKFQFNVEAYKATIADLERALYSGVESRMGTLLAQFAVQLPKLTEAGSRAELDLSKSNLTNLIENFYAQVQNRLISISDGQFNAEELIASIRKSTSATDLSAILGRFDAPAANAEEFSGDFQAANARLQVRLIESLGTVIDEIEKIAPADAQSGTLRRDFNALLKRTRLNTEAFLEQYQAGVQRSIDQYNKALSDTLLGQGIPNNNNFSAVLSRIAISGAANDRDRARFNLGPLQPDFVRAQQLPNVGEIGFNNALLQDSTAIKQLESDLSALGKQLTIVNGVVVLSKDSTQEYVYAAQKYESILQMLNNRQIRYNETLFGSEQAQAFSAMTSQVRAVNNEYDLLLARVQNLNAQEFAGAMKGAVSLPNVEITSLPELGRNQTQNRLLKYQELEMTARRNYESLTAAADDALARNNTDEYNRLVTLSNQALQTASSFRTLQEEIQGRGGLFSSFAEGAGEVVSAWKAAATNFKEIGRSITESFSSSFSSAFASFAIGAQNAKQAFQDFARSFLQTAIQLFAQKAIQSLLGMAFGGAGGIATAATGALSGGSAGAQIGGRLSGGLIPGLPAGRDNLVSYLESGEFIIPSNIVRKYGAAHFEAYRQGRSPLANDRRFIPVTEADKKRLRVRRAFMKGGSVGMLSSPSEAIQMRLGGIVSEIPAFYEGGVASKSSTLNFSSYYTGGLVEKPVSAKEYSKVSPVANKGNSTSVSISVPVTMNVTSSGNKESDQSAIAKAGVDLQRIMVATIDERLTHHLRQGGALRTTSR